MKREDEENLKRRYDSKLGIWSGTEGYLIISFEVVTHSLYMYIVVGAFYDLGAKL